MALGFPLGGQAADSRWHLGGLRSPGECNRLLGIVTVESDKRMTDKAVRGEVVIAALSSEIDRASCPPQGTPLDSCLLYQPSHVFRVTGPEDQ